MDRLIEIETVEGPAYVSPDHVVSLEQQKLSDEDSVTLVRMVDMHTLQSRTSLHALAQKIIRAIRT